MDRRRLLPLLTAPLFAQPQQDPNAIRVDVSLVNVPFSVRDARGQLVKTLTRDDIEVLEDGVPQSITHFSIGAESTLSLGLIADFSGSQKDYLKEHRRDLRDFLRNVMQPRDQAFLVGFGNGVRLISAFTDNMERLTERLQRFQKDPDPAVYPRVGPRESREGGSAFYDAIYHSADEILAKSETGRRALIIFSDGEDNASAHHMLDAIEIAQSTGALVFCLRYTDLQGNRWNARNKYGRGVMQRLAKETGGLEFDAAESDNLRDAFRQIADVLRASYDLAYKSSHTTTEPVFRKIQIRGKRPGLTVRHKTGYYARPL